MSVLKGWELSPDRKELYDKIIEQDPIEDPILISKCRLGKNHGLLVVSDNGFAWALKFSFRSSWWDMGKTKWVRWHDVSRIIPAKPKKGYIKVECYKRKNGELVTKRSGTPKVFRWKVIVERNKGEDKSHFKQRRSDFYRLMEEIYNRNKPSEIPVTSDSRM